MESIFHRSNRTVEWEKHPALDKGTEGASVRSDKINGERVKNDDAAAARKDIAL